MIEREVGIEIAMRVTAGKGAQVSSRREETINLTT